MYFSKAEKVLNEINSFNPPPGYYSYEDPKNLKPISNANTNFPRENRFVEKAQLVAPGPGYYYNDKTEQVRKRLLQESRRKQTQYKNYEGESEIKISSIPSIPKKSTTRVYQELAPGILILHEEENQNSNVGPGSYNVNYDVGYKKSIAYKINPQSKERAEPPEPEVKIPTVAQQIRNEKRQLYKRSLIKSTGLSKNVISPSDLCLEVIILREKLLRAEENPPPGYYYNEKYQSTFKQPDPDLLPEYQLMMGKQQRFIYQKPDEATPIGPGTYQIQAQANKPSGGFIPKGERQLSVGKKFVPGPGAYKIEGIKAQKTNPKGNYPPIFGSGNNRFSQFASCFSEMPGPGSYKVDEPWKKKQRHIKIKKEFYQSQMAKPQPSEPKDLISLSGDKSGVVETSTWKQRNNRKNNHYFTSKVQRFAAYDKTGDVIVGPGNYEINSSSLMKGSFNKKKDYTGPKQPRFDETKIRPNLGPGAYFSVNDAKKY